MYIVVLYILKEQKLLGLVRGGSYAKNIKWNFTDRLLNLGSVNKGDSVKLILDLTNLGVDLNECTFKLINDKHVQETGFNVIGNELEIDLDFEFTFNVQIVDFVLEVTSMTGKITTDKFFMLVNPINLVKKLKVESHLLCIY